MSEKSFSYDAHHPAAILDLLRDLKEYWFRGLSRPPLIVELTLADSTSHKVYDELRNAIGSYMESYNFPRSCFRVRSEPNPVHRMVIKH